MGRNFRRAASIQITQCLAAKTAAEQLKKHHCTESYTRQASISTLFAGLTPSKLSGLALNGARCIDETPTRRHNTLSVYPIRLSRPPALAR